MLSRKVIVQNITNLTDARYFAAWGVDYLSYNLHKESPYLITPAAMKEISEWVEGPKTLVESNAVEYMEGVDGNILADAYSSLPLTKEAFFRTTLSEVQKGLPNGHYIIKITDNNLGELQNLPQDKVMGLNLWLDITDLDFSHLAALPEHGLVVQGGEEEKVGVKSFDALDELYEWLLNEEL